MKHLIKASSIGLLALPMGGWGISGVLASPEHHEFSKPHAFRRGEAFDHHESTHNRAFGAAPHEFAGGYHAGDRR